MGKDKPLEVSSKKRVSRTVDVFKPKKIERRDPRFTGTPGKVSMIKFAKHYKFLEEKQREESDQLRKEIRECEDEERKSELMLKQQQLHQRMTMQKKGRNEEILKRKMEQQNEKRILKGQQPKYLKKEEIKKMVDKQTYGKKLSKVEEKRSKREGSKMMKRMPKQRKMN